MTRTKVITFLSFMISISVILQYIEISIPFLPSFLKLDFSDVPQILTTALLGPWMGILVSLCKNGIHLFISQSGFIGELSNFILGASFCLIFGYIWPHSKKAGILLACIFMAFMSYYSNYYLIYPLYYICTGRVRTKTKNINKLFNKHRKLVDGLLVLASCFIIILMPKLITIFSVLKDSYGYQLVHMNKTYNPSITVFILMTLTVMPFILQYRRDVKLDRDYNFYTMVLIMSTILWQVTGVSQESYRVILPLWGILMIAVPKLITVSKYTIVIFGYYVVLGILYFIILFVRLGVNNIYPYASRILGV